MLRLRERAVHLAQLLQRDAGDRRRRGTDVVEAPGADVQPVEAVHGAVQRVAEAALGRAQGRVRARPPDLRPGSDDALVEEPGLGLRPVARDRAEGADCGDQPAVLEDGGGEPGARAGRVRRGSLPLRRAAFGGRRRQHERAAIGRLGEIRGERAEVRRGRRVLSRAAASLDQPAGLVDFEEGDPRGRELLHQEPDGGLLDLEGVVQRQQRIHQTHEEGSPLQALPLFRVHLLDAVGEGDEREHPRTGERAEPDEEQVLAVHAALRRP